MKLDPELEEKPYHGHYAACLARKTDIERRSSLIFGCTVVSGIALTIVSFAGWEMPVLSWIPSLINSSTVLFPICIQCAEIMGLSILAALGFGKNKSFNCILQLIYIVMTVASLFTGSMPGCFFSFVAGAAGAFLCRHAFKDASDYEALKKTEGYPHFSEHYAEYIEHPKYSSRYTEEVYRKSRGEEITAKKDADTYSSGYETRSTRLSEERSAPSMESVGFMDDLPSVLPNVIPDPDGDSFEPLGGSSDVSYPY